MEEAPERVMADLRAFLGTRRRSAPAVKTRATRRSELTSFSRFSHSLGRIVAACVRHASPIRPFPPRTAPTPTRSAAAQQTQQSPEKLAEHDDQLPQMIELLPARNAREGVDHELPVRNGKVCG